MHSVSLAMRLFCSDGANGTVRTWRLVLRVSEPPILRALEDGVQDALGGHVEGRGQPPCGMNPVDDALAVGVLVVIWDAA